MTRPAPAAAADPPSLADLVEEIDRETAALPEADRSPQTGPEGPEPGRAVEPCIRFTLGSLLMAIPMAASLEINPLGRVTPLPNLPGWLLGVANLRGEIVSVVDLEAFLGLAPAGDGPGGRGRPRMLILVRDAETTMGLAVDRVAGLFHLDRRAAVRPSPYREGDPEEKMTAYLEGVLPPEAAGLDDERRLVHLLDIRELLTSPRMTAFMAE